MRASESSRAGEDSPKQTSEEIHQRITVNAVYTVLGTAATALFTMGAFAFAARGLPVAQFGLLVLLQSAALALRGMLGVGTQQPIVHLGAAALKSADKERLGQLIGLGLLLDFGTAAASCLVGFLLVVLAGDLLGIGAEERSHAFFFVLAVLFMGYLTSNGLFRIMNRFRLMAFIQAAATAVLFAAAGFMYAIGAPFEFYVYTWAVYLGLGVQAQLAVALVLMYQRGVQVSFAVGKLSITDRGMFRSYAWSTWGTILVQSLRTHGDSLLVGALLGAGPVGIYNAAKQLAGLLRKLTDNYTAVIFPEVARLAAESRRATARKLLWRMGWIGAGVGLTGVVGVALLGEAVLRITFGPTFSAGYGVLILLTAASALQLVSSSFVVYVPLYLSPSTLFWMYLAALGVYMPAAGLGTAFIGITGAALGQIAFSATIVVIAAATIMALRKTELGSGFRRGRSEKNGGNGDRSP